MQQYHNYSGSHESWNVQQQQQQGQQGPQQMFQQQQQQAQPQQQQSSQQQQMYSGRPPSAASLSHNPSVNQRVSDDEKVYSWIIELMHGTSREQALLELSKKREQYDDLALILWHSFGVMTSLLHEIITVYPLLSPPNLTAHASNRVCNALALLQCVASHNETRALFLNGK